MTGDARNYAAKQIPDLFFRQPAFEKDFKVVPIDSAGLIEVRALTKIIARIAVVVQPEFQ